MTTIKTPADQANDLDIEIAGRIGRAWREIRRGSTASDARDAIFGVGGSSIEPGQMDALELLVVVESCRMGDLAEYLRIDPSTATRAVQRLIKDNLAERVQHAGDGRVVAIAVTERGRRIHGEVNDRRRAILFAVMNEFNPEERFALADLMERFTLSVDAAIKAKKHRHH
jgi:DNA-binding MarR family transcriptional regulator